MAEWLARKDCCCRHPDARACLMIRAEPGEENDPPPGEACDCRCHERDDDDEI